MTILAAALTACVPDQPQPSVPTDTTAVPVPLPTFTTLAPSTDARASSELQAPFDPCSIITWADFPEQIRSDSPAEPELMEVAPDDAFLTGCRYNGSSAAYIPYCAAPPCDELPPPDFGKIFIVNVAWGEMSLDPADYGAHAEQVTIGGRAGVLVEDQGYRGMPMCIVTFAVERGVAGIAVTDGRFGLDTCALVSRLAGLITERLPECWHPAGPSSCRTLHSGVAAGGPW